MRMQISRLIDQRSRQRIPARRLSRKWICSITLALVALAPSALCADTVAPLQTAGLRALVDQANRLEPAGPIDGGNSFSAYLVAYRHAGLRLHALVAVPLTPPPPQGYPVLVANHGFHPDPPRYGITPEGRNWRPGNYYRPVPAAYAAAGFLVVMPDYRGHNVSEGREFTTSPLASAYYAEDVVALLAAMDTIDHADTHNVFMWGHSMGGPVTIEAALAVVGSRVHVRGASLWSTVATTQRLADLTIPLLLQHALGDKSTDHRNSAELASALAALGKAASLYSHSGSDHFFAGAQFDTAVARDIDFFRSLMATNGPR